MRRWFDDTRALALAACFVVPACGGDKSSLDGATVEQDASPHVARDGGTNPAADSGGGAAGAGGETAPPVDADSSPSDDDAGPDVLPLVPIGGACKSDSECDNGMYCDGKELCIEQPNDQTHALCQRGPPPCAAAACSNDERRCDCGFRGGDVDGDGHAALGCSEDERGDCDDDNDEIHPGRAESCDAVDDDCDPRTIATLEDGDRDHDEHIDHGCRNLDLYQRKWIAGSDRDDARDDVHPDAEEKCDGVDNDCNGVVDEDGKGVPGGMRITFYADRDGDGFGSAKAADDDQLEALCSTPPDRLWSLQATDCDDKAPFVHPNRMELCNGHDDNCNDSVDEPPFDEKPDFTDTAVECRGAGGWAITRCPPITDNCNGVVTDGCETPLDTLCNCRSCGSACRFACGAGDCQEIAAFSIGGSHTCAITGTEGEIVSCWGANHRGQVGEDSINEAAVPKRVVRLGGVVQVATGDAHSCAVATNGGRLFCWGDDSDGQLGSVATDDRALIPVPVGGLEGGQLDKVNQVAAGARHTCAILSGGKLVCWGLGDHGQLGDRLAAEHVALGPVETYRGSNSELILNAKQVAAGFRHTCLLTTEGTVECAGDNSLQQLGSGSTDPRADSFRPVPGLAAVDEIAAGTTHTCARSEGRVYCWGSNDYGQLGVAQSSGGPPVPVANLGSVRSIAAGGGWSCAVDSQHVVRCWGSNVSGQLGDPASSADFEPHPLPVVSHVGPVRSIFGGYGPHVCAITLDGRGVCWGANDTRQLGAGLELDFSSAPQDVRSLDGSVECEQ